MKGTWGAVFEVKYLSFSTDEESLIPRDRRKRAATCWTHLYLVICFLTPRSFSRRVFCFCTDARSRLHWRSGVGGCKAAGPGSVSCCVFCHLQCGRPLTSSNKATCMYGYDPRPGGIIHSRNMLRFLVTGNGRQSDIEMTITITITNSMSIVAAVNVDVNFVVFCTRISNSRFCAASYDIKILHDYCYFPDLIFVLLPSSS